MNFSRKTLNRVFGTIGVTGFVLMFNSVGTLDYNSEACIPDEPITWVLLIVGFLMFGISSIYNEITGAWKDIE